MKKPLKILLTTILTLIVVLAAAFLVANIYRRARYSDFYSMATNAAPNEGLGDGYLPEDVTALSAEDEVIYFTCGKAKKDAPSRIYMIKNNSEETYFSLVDEFGNDILTEFEGISVTNNYLLVSGNYNLYIIDLSHFINVIKTESSFLIDQTSNKVAYDACIKLDVSGDFLSVDNKGTTRTTDDILYVGSHSDLSTNYVYAYSLYDVLDGNLVLKYKIAIINNVEGLAVSNDKIVLVKPSGIFRPSSYYVYNKPLDEVSSDVYVLDDSSLEEVIEGPSLAAGLDYVDGNFITLFQSASNKYFYGKFLFTNKIMSLAIK